MVNTLYQCNICKEMYEKRSDAEKCEYKGIPKPKFKIGDIVSSTCSDNLGVFKAKIIWVGKDDHKRIWYNIRAIDDGTKRFVRGGVYPRGK